MRSQSLSLFPMPHKPGRRRQTGAGDFRFKDQGPGWYGIRLRPSAGGGAAQS